MKRRRGLEIERPVANGLTVDGLAVDGLAADRVAGDGVAGDGVAVVGTARGDRARLDFLLELGHDLRTPVGVIAGYLEMAHQGEITAQAAVDATYGKAKELCALVDTLLALSEAELKTREGWRQRITDAHAQSDRLRTQSISAIDMAKRTLSRLEGAGGRPKRR